MPALIALVYVGAMCYICKPNKEEDMNDSDAYELISVAYRSRLLCRTEAEYRQALGVSLETVANNRGSERDMKVYYDLLSHHAAAMEGMTLREIIAAYASASKLYLSLDWGDRSQMASRRRFCRMLFRLYVTKGLSLTSDEIFKYKVKDDDERLLRAFFPDGAAGEPAADIGLTMLFVFGVIRPWSGGNSRGHDLRDKETAASLERLRSMIEQLRDDTPRLGSTDKPLVFSQCLTAIDSHLRDPKALAEATPLWFYSMITDICLTCRSLMSAKQKREAGERLQGIYMPGIWIDDADHGKSRFWIFPDNMLQAFCYRRCGLAWELVPYELNIRFSDDDDYYDTYFIIAPEGNLRFILSSEKAIGEHQVAMGNCEAEYDSDDEITRFSLIADSRPMPEWVDWHVWERLSPGSELHAQLRQALRDMYDPSSPHSMLFHNTAPELTDTANMLAGRDRKYIYVHDRQPRRFAMMEKKPDRFTYEPDTDENGKALFELEISDEHPLYAIPRSLKKSKHASRQVEALADMLADADNIAEAYIVHSPRCPLPRLAFPAYSVVVSLDMDALAELGVLKLTRRPL